MTDSSCVRQVRLRKVERMRREGLGVDALLRPRHGPGMTRSSSHASVTSSVGSLAYSLEAFETFEAYEPVCSYSLSLPHDAWCLVVCYHGPSPND